MRTDRAQRPYRAVRHPEDGDLGAFHDVGAALSWGEVAQRTNSGGCGRAQRTGTSGSLMSGRAGVNWAGDFGANRSFQGSL